MNVNIREIMYANHKEKIQQFRNTLNNIQNIGKEIALKVVKGRRIDDLPLEERRIYIGVVDAFRNVNKTLDEELNKIDQGLATSDDKTTNYLRHTLQKALDNFTEETKKVDEYIKVKDNQIVITKLNEWHKGFKSYFEHY